MMEGCAEPRERGCLAETASQRAAGNRHLIPKANWLHVSPSRALANLLINLELDSGVCLVSVEAMKESHEAVLDSPGCRTEFDFRNRRLQ